MNELLKQAFEEGKRLAEQEHVETLEKAVKKRERTLGWKEKDVAPARLTKGYTSP